MKDTSPATEQPRDALFRRLHREARVLRLPTGSATTSPIGRDDLEALPAPARRYMDFMRVVGQPRHFSFCARFEGRFQLRGRWMVASAWQYNTATPVARLYVMRLRLAGVVPMTGVDTYVDGRGEMSGKLLGLFPVAHGEGEEFDMGELVTWLNDAVLLAPTFLLEPAVTWGEVDDESFHVSVQDADRSVTGRVFVDERGAPMDFCSSDRFADLPEGLTVQHRVRHRAGRLNRASPSLRRPACGQR